MAKNNKMLDVHAMLLELKKQGYEVDSIIKDCENHDSKIKAAQQGYANARYGQHIGWCKEQLNKTGVYTVVGGNATLVFKVLCDQAIEGSCEVKVSLSDLEEQTSLSTNTIKKSLKALQNYAMIVLIKKGIGTAESVYRLNPDLVQIGKTTNQSAASMKIAFYKLTGTTYEYNHSVLVAKKSAAHKRFEEATQTYEKNHKRAFKSYLDENDIPRSAGAFLSNDEFKKFKEQKKVPNVADTLDTEMDDYPLNKPIKSIDDSSQNINSKNNNNDEEPFS